MDHDSFTVKTLTISHICTRRTGQTLVQTLITRYLQPKSGSLCVGQDLSETKSGSDYQNFRISEIQFLPHFWPNVRRKILKIPKKTPLDLKVQNVRRNCLVQNLNKVICVKVAVPKALPGKG